MFSTTAKTGCVQDRALALVFPRIAVISPLIVSSLLRSRFNIEAKWIFLKYKPDSTKKKENINQILFLLCLKCFGDMLSSG